VSRDPRQRLGVDLEELPGFARSAGEVRPAASAEQERAALGDGPRPDADAGPCELVETVAAHLLADPEGAAQHERLGRRRVVSGATSVAARESEDGCQLARRRISGEHRHGRADRPAVRRHLLPCEVCCVDELYVAAAQDASLVHTIDIARG
jgi:hypothetical protein